MPPLSINALANAEYLLSPDPRTIAQGMSEAMIYDMVITELNHARGQSYLRDQLLTLRDALWNSKTPQDLNAILHEPDPDTRRILMEALVRFGQIYEMAGLIARDNVFKAQKEDGKPISGGAQALISGFTSPKQAVDALHRPHFAMTFTAHPTNVVALEAISAQRTLLRAIDRVRFSHDIVGSGYEEALHAFLSTPILPLDADGNEKKLSVGEETDHMLYYVQNLYRDLPHIYDRFDTPMREKFTRGYNPIALTLPLSLASWGSSGDKDGNQNVNAETTLRAIAMHRLTMLALYTKSLEKIDPEAFAQTIESLQEISRTIQASLPPEGFLTPAAFDAASAALQVACASLDAKGLEAELTRHYHAADTGGRKEALLDMIRRVRLFGLDGAAIEYRETAEEFSRIFEAILPGYADTLDDIVRTELLTEALRDPDKKAQLTQAFEALCADGHGQAYSKTDAAPIAYHTKKRLELARDFPSLIRTHVLAECKGTSNFLEALALQTLVATPEKPPRLAIVPLFEEYKVLEQCSDILRDALANPLYRAHIKSLGEPPTQQVQLAHSDNARRAGMPAARAYIYEAHQTLRDAARDSGVAMQFYEGGSQSDPYRGGVRSLSASMNEFGIHDFAKFTFQGGDLLNYLNYPSSAIRLLTRNISHCAHVLAEQEDPLLKIQTRDKSDLEPKLDKAAILALKRTVSDYENNVFLNPAFNEFMEIVGYNKEKDAGNVGSRAGTRSDDTAVDVKTARTITFSETLQHAGITPTWIGARNLYSYLGDALGGKAPTPEELHAVYKGSPVFRDVVDRMLFGLAKTDIDGLRARIPELKNSMFLDDLAQEYRYSARLALEAFTGEPVREAEVARGGVKLRDLRARIIADTLPHLAETIDDKNHYMAVVDTLKDAWCAAPANDNERALRALAHAAGDTVHHSRFVAADDASYGKLLLAHANDTPQRPGRSAA